MTDQKTGLLDLAETKWLSTSKFAVSAQQQSRLTEQKIAIDWLDFITIDYGLSPGAEALLTLMALAVNPFVVLASQNSVRTLHRYFSLKDLVKDSLKFRFLCIGKQTAILTQRFFPGSRVEYLANSMQGALPFIRQLVHRNSHTINRDFRLYFCAAQEPLPILGDFLKANSIPFQHIPLYRTILQPHKVSQFYDGILFYSPSGVRAFFTANPNYPQIYNNSLQFVCIGRTTAEALQKFQPNSEYLLPAYASKLGLIDLILGIKK